MTPTSPSLSDMPGPRAPCPPGPAAIAAGRARVRKDARGWLTYRADRGIAMPQDALQSHAAWLGPAKLVVHDSHCWELHEAFFAPSRAATRLRPRATIRPTVRSSSV